MLSALRPKLLERRENCFAEEAEIFAEIIKIGQQIGDFQLGDALETAEDFLRAANSLLPFSLTTEEPGERLDIEARTLRTANLLLKVLRNI